MNESILKSLANYEKCFDSSFQFCAAGLPTNDGEPQIIINGPPDDLRCQCCGKSASELTPYRITRDRLIEDPDGTVLVRLMRPEAPPLTEEQKAVANEFLRKQELRKLCDAPDLEPEAGKELDQLLNDYVSSLTFAKSWECLDCAYLDDEGYFEKLRERYARERASSEP